MSESLFQAEARPQDAAAAASKPPHHLSEHALRAVVEHAPDGVFVADLQGRYRYVNAAGCRMLGYARDELIGKTILDLIPAQDAPRLQRTKEVMLEGRQDLAEWTLRRKDGGWLPVEITANILPDGQWLGFVRDISERKKAAADREALFQDIEAERRFLQTTMDTLPVAVLVFRSGEVTANAHAEKMLGMKLVPALGNAQYVQVMHQRDGTPLTREELISSRAMQKGHIIAGEEFLIRRDDGTELPVIGCAAPFMDASGALIGAVAVYQDVSEHMRMEERLHAKQQTLQTVFNLLPVGVWITDETGRIALNNPAGERIWQGARYVPVSEYGEYKGWRISTGEPIAAEDWALAQAFTRGKTTTGELIRIQCFDGSFKTIINSAAPLRGPEGEIKGAVVVNEDITELYETQERQRSAEQLMRTIFNLLPIGLWVADREGKITFANPAGQSIWSGVEYVGPREYGVYKGWWVETGEPVAQDDWGLNRALRGETSRSELIRIQCFDGSFKTIINWAAPIRSDSGEIVGAIAANEDVTSLQHTQEQLRHAVGERERILAIVAHDLRSPLMALMTYGAAVKQGAAKLADGERVQDNAVAMVDIARQMSGMVDDLLAVAAATSGGHAMLKLTSVSPSRLLSQAAQGMRPLLSKRGLELDLHVTENLPPLRADVNRIVRVLSNLLDNALKFTEPPGRVIMMAQPTMAGIQFCVANSGEPLPGGQIEHMFEPFWQAERNSRGTGLGLSICRSIVEAHGGSIWAEPAAGQRLRVCFVLPRA